MSFHTHTRCIRHEGLSSHGHDRETIVNKVLRYLYSGADLSQGEPGTPTRLSSGGCRDARRQSGQASVGRVVR